jgi:glutamate/tyrosine decarboxylase-like PLP-dependent enzyme
MTVANSIHSQVSQWLGSLFFNDSVASFLTSNTECLSKALRLALTCKFDNYLQDGLSGIKSPSIYINGSNPYLPDMKFAAHLIGLPQSSIKVISFGDGCETLNVEELEKQIAADVASGSVPLFLFADMGSSFSGVVDGTVTDLSALSDKHQLWLHLSGSLIASFTLAQNQSEITKNVSSMSLDLESWLGLPNISTVLLHKQFPALSQSIFEIENDMRKIEAFPLWTVMQNIGRDRVIAAFTQALQSCRTLYEMVSKTRGFRMLSRSTPTSDDNPNELSTVTVVLFQFDGSNFQDNQAGGALTGDDVVKKAIEKVNNASYFDRLNSWLGQTLERDFPQVQLSLMDHPIYGTCLRYAPFELSIGEKVKRISFVSPQSN